MAPDAGPIAWAARDYFRTRSISMVAAWGVAPFGVGLPGRHRAPQASPAARVSRSCRSGGIPGTATMSHRGGQDRNDVTSLRLAALSPAPPDRGGRGPAGREGPRGPAGRNGARGAAAPAALRLPTGNSLRRSHTLAASTP